MSKYDRLAGKQEEGDSRIWNRYGFTESQWAQLTTQERELHYNRQKVCDHPYGYDGPDWSGDTSLESLRTAYSHDAYFHIAHLDKCQRPALSIKECSCQMCANKIGISNE